MKPEHIPNLITLMRFLLVPPVAVLIVEGHYGWALTLFLVAGVSDGIDGFLARHFDWRTRLGAILDPLADKTLMVTTYVLLGWQGHLPWWIAALVVARDVVIIGGAVAYLRVTRRLEMEPSVISKFNTVVQVLLVLLVLGSLALYRLDESYVWGLAGVMALTTLVSGAHYVWVWGHRAREASQRVE